MAEVEDDLAKTQLDLHAAQQGSLALSEMAQQLTLKDELLDAERRSTRELRERVEQLESSLNLAVNAAAAVESVPVSPPHADPTQDESIFAGPGSPRHELPSRRPPVAVGPLPSRCAP